MTRKAISTIIASISLISATALIATSFNTIMAIPDTITHTNNVQRVIEESKSRAQSVKDTFTSNRSFDISYNEVDKLTELFNSAAGITVTEVTPIEGSNVPDLNYSTVKMVLQVKDLTGSLSGLNRVQLPIKNIEITGDQISVEFYVEGQ